MPSPVLSDEDPVRRLDMDAGTHNPRARRRTPGQRKAGGGPDSGLSAN